MDKRSSLFYRNINENEIKVFLYHFAPGDTRLLAVLGVHQRRPQFAQQRPEIIDKLYKLD
jgi:hypothetical protein